MSLLWSRQSKEVLLVRLVKKPSSAGHQSLVNMSLLFWFQQIWAGVRWSHQRCSRMSFICWSSSTWKQWVSVKWLFTAPDSFCQQAWTEPINAAENAINLSARVSVQRVCQRKMYFWTALCTSLSLARKKRPSCYSGSSKMAISVFWCYDTL